MIPIMLVTIAYVLGIIGGLYKICIVPFCLILCLLLFRKNKIIIISGYLFFVAGILLTLWRLSLFDNSYKNEDIDFECTIISDEIEKENVNSFIVKNHNGDKFIIYVDKRIKLEYGMKAQIKGDFQLPPISRNRRWL